MIRVVIYTILTLISYNANANQYESDANIIHNNINSASKKIQQQAQDFINTQNNSQNRFLQDNSLNQIVDNNKYNRYLQEMMTDITTKDFTESYQASKSKQLNQLMVFISASMPISALELYAIDVRRAGGVMVLRGLIDDSFAKTISYINSLNKDGAIAIIDPLSYETFKIEHVPQIVVISDNHNCQWGRCQTTPFHDKISGNITIKHALTEISKRGEFANKEASRFLSNL